MKPALRVLTFLTLLIFVSFTVAQAWWNQWMYHGWGAPPEFFHAAFGPFDGEASYNVTLNEMWLTSALAITLVIVVPAIARKRIG